MTRTGETYGEIMVITDFIKNTWWKHMGKSKVLLVSPITIGTSVTEKHGDFIVDLC